MPHPGSPRPCHHPLAPCPAALPCGGRTKPCACVLTVCSGLRGTCRPTTPWCSAPTSCMQTAWPRMLRSLKPTALRRNREKGGGCPRSCCGAPCQVGVAGRGCRQHACMHSACMHGCMGTGLRNDGPCCWDQQWLPRPSASWPLHLAAQTCWCGAHSLGGSMAAGSPPVSGLHQVLVPCTPRMLARGVLR